MKPKETPSEQFARDIALLPEEDAPNQTAVSYSINRIERAERALSTARENLRLAVAEERNKWFDW